MEMKDNIALIMLFAQIVLMYFLTFEILKGEEDENTYYRF